MSGTLRRAIGPQKRFLREHIATLRNYRLGKPSNNENPKEYFQKKLSEIAHLYRQLKTDVENLDKRHEEWITLINDFSRPAEEREEDKEAYETMAADEQDGVIWVLELGRQALLTAESYLEEAQLAFTQQVAQPTVAPSLAAPPARTNLPPLKIKAFDGDPQKWKEFRDHFQAAIRDSTLKPVEKLNYLLSSLTGAAARAVEGYSLTNDNYPIVWDLLIRRFGDTNILRRTLYSELQLVHGEDLRHTFETVERILRQLENLGENLEHPHLQMLIEDKLPQWALKEIFTEKQKQTPWTMQSLRAHLEALVLREESVSRITNAREHTENASESSAFAAVARNRIPPAAGPSRSSQYSSAPRTSHRTFTRHQNEKGLDEPTRSFKGQTRAESKPLALNRGTHSAQRGDKPPPLCAFCNQQHWTDSCKQYSTHATRNARARELNICFRCLRKGHLAFCCNKRASCYYCKEQHSSALCPRHPTTAAVAVSPPQEFSPVADEETITIAAAEPQKAQVLLLCREIEVHSLDDPGLCTTATVFFDVGSQRSYVTDNLAQKLKLHSQGKEKLSVAGFANKVHSPYDSERVILGLKRTDRKIQKIFANTLTHLTPPLQYVQLNTNEEYNGLKKLKCKKPDILIGADHYFQFIANSLHTRLNSGFYVIDSSVGPILGGKATHARIASQNHILSAVTCSAVDEASPTTVICSTEDSREINELWALEHIGITESPTQDDDTEALRLFNCAVKRHEDGRYSVSWPWKTELLHLPTNFGLCFGRLKSLLSRIKLYDERHPTTDSSQLLMQRYSATFKQWEDHGIIEEVPVLNTKALIHYLPHQIVLTPQKLTTKIRPVFDASASCEKGHALNDHLYRGPIFLPEMLGILLRFRNNSIVLLADIEKAFLQIAINEDQRDFTRFIWLNDINQPLTNSNIKHYRFARIPFGIKCCPFMLAAVIRHHLCASQSPLADTILQNLYVDNLMLTFSTPSNAIDAYTEIKQIFKDACMNIRTFLSNSKAVHEAIPPEDRQEKFAGTTRSGQIIKVLGVPWDSSQDTLFLTINETQKHFDTKRKLLSFLSAIYDPLGLMQPILLPLKLLLQELWKAGYEWDDQIAPSHISQLQQITQEWHFERAVPRMILSHRDNPQFHVFVDASAKAYAAVVYVKLSPNSTPNILIAKSRLAPVKPVSIPKLELLAMVIGVRLLKFAVMQLRVQNSLQYLWSDSRCVLYWVSNTTTEQPRFINNRIREIREATHVKMGYVNTLDNPADIATRGVRPAELQDMHKWWIGPSWLKKDESSWPQWVPSDKATSEEPDEENGELNADVSNAESQELTAVSVHQENRVPWKIIEEKRFSKWHRMVNATAYALRFLKKIAKERSCFHSLNNISTDGPLTAADSETASKLLIRQAQSEENCEKEQKRWELYDDDENIVRCGGRIPKDLIYLPRQSHITALLVMKIHDQLAHSGIGHTLSEVRKSFWIPKGRATVKRVIHRYCYVCRQWNAKPFALPPMPNHPRARIEERRPFQTTGIDLFGPINIKTAQGVQKRWVSLFTCLSTRAIHLEPVKDSSALAFLHSFRRFLAKWDTPDVIITDNATNFQLTSKTIIKQFMAHHEITWKFNTPYAPWTGGFFERLVGLTKNAMRKMIGRKALNEEEFTTLIAEVARIINTRPLTYVSEEPLEIVRPLDLIVPKAQKYTPIAAEEDNDTDEEYLPISAPSRDVLLSHWKSSIGRMNHFWDMWRTEYLNALRERTQRKIPQSRSVCNKEPQVGEVVLIEEESVPRGRWKWGKILEVQQGTENKIKAATVRTPNGREWKRPLNLLYPLEISHEEDTSETHKASRDFPTGTHGTVTGVSSSVKPPATKYPFYLLLLLNMILLTTSQPNIKCGIKGQEAIVPLPVRHACPQAHNDSIHQMRVTIATREFDKLGATFCAQITRTVCTHAFLRWVLSVARDDIAIVGVPPAVCKHLKLYKEYQGIKLDAEGPNRWKSHNPTTYSYGWIGERCTPTTNFILEEGFIAFHNGATIITPLSSTDRCNVKAGICLTKHSTLMWNTSAIGHTCHFKKRGSYEGQLVGNHLIIDAIQTAFVLKPETNQTTNARLCGFKRSRTTTRSDVLLLFEGQKGPPGVANTENSKNRLRGNRLFAVELVNNNMSDPTNGKLQYLFEKLQKEIKERTLRNWQHVCKNENRIVSIIQWISTTKPMVAAKILLERSDVTEARRIGNTLLVRCSNEKEEVPPTREEHQAISQNIIFGAGRLEEEQRQDLILEAIQQRKNLEEEGGSSHNNKTVTEELRSEAEHILQEVEHVADVAAQEIQKDLKSVAESWQGITAGLVAVAAAIITAVMCLKCSFARQLCWLLCKKRKKGRELKVKYDRKGESVEWVEEAATGRMEVISKRQRKETVKGRNQKDGEEKKQRNTETKLSKFSTTAADIAFVPTLSIHA